MVNFLQSFRALAGIFLLVSTIFLSFNGFGFGAFVSLFGSFLVLWGMQIAVAVLLHKSAYGASYTGLSRVICVVAGFAVAWFGEFLVNTGGLISINVANFPINLQYAGVLMGIAGGIWDIDKELIK